MTTTAAEPLITASTPARDQLRNPPCPAYVLKPTQRLLGTFSRVSYRLRQTSATNLLSPFLSSPYPVIVTSSPASPLRTFHAAPLIHPPASHPVNARGAVARPVRL